MKFDRLPPEAVAQVKWGQKVLHELRAGPDPAAASPGETWRRRLWCLRQGFLPNCYDLYAFAENDPREYLSDRGREMTWVLNWPYAGILDDKLGFDYMIKHLGAPTPELRALVLEGRLEPLDDGHPTMGGGWWQEHLDRLGRLVLKPIWGGQGNGIQVLQRAGTGVLLNGDDITLDELEARVSRMDRYVVSDFAQQAAYAQEIFPGSANTMRVLTMHDDDRVPFIAAAVHRFGTKRSRGPVDNASAGGLSAGIDLESGALSSAVSVVLAPRERHDRHPDTGAPITGTQVTNWDVIRAGVLELARKLPFLPYIGWDVMATDSGYLVIEGNKQSDVQLLQAHGPLLRDPRVRAFYEREGIL